MKNSQTLSLEDIVIATYSALDDALAEAGIRSKKGKLIPRSGPAPEVEDREILCLAVLQELLGFESDNYFHLWLENEPVMRALFPRMLSRQNFADRRALLTPLVQRLCSAFISLDNETDTPFSSLTPIPLTSAAPYEKETKSA